MSTGSVSAPVALVNNAGITGPVRDPHDYTAGDMTEAVALFTGS